jgi:hypothetical protein
MPWGLVRLPAIVSVRSLLPSVIANLILTGRSVIALTQKHVHEIPVGGPHPSKLIRRNI